MCANLIKIVGGREYFGSFLVDLIWNDPTCLACLVNAAYIQIYMFQYHQVYLFTCNQRCTYCEMDWKCHPGIVMGTAVG